MDTVLKQRLVGAAVLVGLAVIFLPMLFNESSEPQEGIAVSSHIPSSPPKPVMQTIINLTPAQMPEHHTTVEKAVSVAPKKTVVALSQPEVIAKSPTIIKPVVIAKPVDNAKKNSVVKRKIAALPPSKPSAPKAMTAAAGWVVQVGSFSDVAHAKLLQKQLHDKGFTAFIQKGKTKNNTITRVFVGPVVKRDQAEALQNKLAKSAQLKGAVVAFTPV